MGRFLSTSVAKKKYDSSFTGFHCRNRVVLLLLVSVWTWGCLREKQPVSSAYQELAAMDTIESQVRQEMAKFDLPGVSLYIMQGNQVLVNTGYGFSDLDANLQVQPDTLFQIGSISKCFTAVVVLKLIEEGHFRLDTPIRELVPRCPVQWEGITVRHLLNHTSGIPEFTTLEEYGDLDFSDPGRISWLAIFPKIAALPLYFQPGTRAAYSNSNYHLLAMAVEQVSGKPFHTYLHQFLVARNFDQILPLDMASQNLAVGYTQQEGMFLPTRPINPSMVTGDSGLVASAPGLAKWLKSLAAGKILGPAMWQAMTKAETLPEMGLWDYGFGLNLRPLQGQAKLAHTGSMPGFSAALAYYPEADLTIALCTNSGDYLYPEQLEINIARKLLDLQFPTLNHLNLDYQQARPFLGVFDAGPLWLQVKMDEGRLVALVRDPRIQHSAVYSYSPLLYQGDYHFIGEQAPDTLVFHFDPETETVAFGALGIRWKGKKLALQMP